MLSPLELLPAAVSAGEIWAAIWPALVVALLRIGDVTVNVFRTVFTVQGRRLAASLAHAFEAVLWLSAAGIVFADVTPARTAGFVLGVGTGTYLGMVIVHKLRLGTVTVRAYVNEVNHEGLGRAVLTRLHTEGYGATLFDGAGYKGPVAMILSTTRRREAQEVIALIREEAPEAFIAIDNDKLEAGARPRV